MEAGLHLTQVTPTSTVPGMESVVAAEEDGKGIGRIRLRHIPDAPASSLLPFIRRSVEPDGLIHTDGWLGYLPLERSEYRHRVTFLAGRKEPAAELLPRVHRVASLLKRWVLGTHQGAVSLQHLQEYLDEFSFRFNRCRSRSRGKLFSGLCSRLSQSSQALTGALQTPKKPATSEAATSWGHLSQMDTHLSGFNG